MKATVNKPLLIMGIIGMLTSLIMSCSNAASNIPQKSVTPSTQVPKPTVPDNVVQFTYVSKVDCSVMSKTLETILVKPPAKQSIYIDQVIWTIPDTNGNINAGRACYLVK